MRRIKTEVQVRVLKHFDTPGGILKGIVHLSKGEEVTLAEYLADYLIERGICEEVDA